MPMCFSERCDDMAVDLAIYERALEMACEYSRGFVRECIEDAAKELGFSGTELLKKFDKRCSDGKNRMS